MQNFKTDLVPWKTAKHRKESRWFDRSAFRRPKNSGSTPMRCPMRRSQRRGASPGPASASVYLQEMKVVRKVFVLLSVLRFLLRKLHTVSFFLYIEFGEFSSPCRWLAGWFLQTKQRRRFRRDNAKFFGRFHKDGCCSVCRIFMIVCTHRLFKVVAWIVSDNVLCVSF